MIKLELVPTDPKTLHPAHKVEEVPLTLIVELNDHYIEVVFKDDLTAFANALEAVATATRRFIKRTEDVGGL